MATQRWTPVIAGVVTALVGWTSSFAVVLAGLTALGADHDQAASGLLVLCVTLGLGTVYLARSTRLPVTLAWSTPGAALLIGSGSPQGGWPAAVGAFAVAALLMLLTSAWPTLGDIVARIPAPIAQAMLAGVLLSICLEPVRALVARPALVAPVVLTWLVVLRVAARWAVPAAFGVVVVIVLAVGGTPEVVAPRPVWTTPTWSAQAAVGLGVPLYLVTMASQNVPGVAVLRSYGFEAPWRRAMAVTGVGTLIGAPLGGHAINLAAISAALTCSPEAARDAGRRWIAAQTAGWCYVGLGLVSATLAGVVAHAPAGLVATAAGLALLPAFAGALSGAVSDVADRLPAAVTLLVGASGVVVAGVGPAFWSLLAGLACRAVLHARARGAQSAPGA